MTRDDIIDAIAEAVREETDEADAEITAETTSDQVPGWDSLAHVRIVLNVGLRLETEIDISDTYTAANVGEFADVIAKTMKAQGKA